MDKRLTRVSKNLAKSLRHAPDELGLTLQPGGWVPVDDLLDAAESHGFPTSFGEPVECVETNDKRRFAFDEAGELIRANQGHSAEVDLRLEEREPPETLYHGTMGRFLPSILAGGLNKAPAPRPPLEGRRDGQEGRGEAGQAGGPHRRCRADAPGRAPVLPIGQRRVADRLRDPRIPVEGLKRNAYAEKVESRRSSPEPCP
jgi:putative RNA 2'-phosphotransferase